MEEKLVAKFKKVENPSCYESIDRDASYWEVFLGDKSITKITVYEISNNRANELYDGIATMEFGQKLIASARGMLKKREEELFSGPLKVATTVAVATPIEFTLHI